jgi:hypothetical protein
MKRAFLAILAMAAILPPAPSARAAEQYGVKFPDQIEVAGKKLVLNGLGTRKATFLKIKVYVGALYLEKKSSDPQQIIHSDEVKRIAMHFVRGVGADKIKDAWKDDFKANCTERCDEAKPEIDKLVKMTGDVNEGDVFGFDFFKDHVDLLFNGKKTGTLQGQPVARALLAIWLGKNPPNDALKDGMLGKG